MRRPAATVALSAVIAACLALGGCLGTRYADVVLDGGWRALPLTVMVTRPTLDPEVIFLCDDAACGAGTAVMTVRAAGPDAAAISTMFRTPARFAAALRRPATRDRPAIEARADVVDLSGYRALRVVLARADGTRAVHGTIIDAGRDGAGHYVLAIGEEAAATDEAALAAIE